jgi:hypothetical protein
MGKYVKYRNRIEKFLQTERGKRFLNEVFPVLATNNPDDRPDFSSATEITDKSTVRSARQKSPQVSVSHSIDLSGAADSVESDNHIVGSLDAVTENVQKFAEATETLTRISESLQESYRYIIDHSQEIGQNSPINYASSTAFMPA